ncbi:hypothetical protein BDA96_03G323600 [Sorghum bicolor]|uniref:Uncharacterized protein n=1 Tax=Sorghum bicolor TaxID=4558 RepID=A0A921RGI7_SORBI|nr:hypothetical protein BDA96_03G323600 [Sorghum bicolor]
MPIYSCKLLWEWQSGRAAVRGWSRKRKRSWRASKGQLAHSLAASTTGVCFQCIVSLSGMRAASCSSTVLFFFNLCKNDSTSCFIATRASKEHCM